MRGPMLTSLWFPFGQGLFGLWLFEWLPAKPPRWLTEGATVDPVIAYPDMARVLFLFLLTMISIGPFIWIDTGRLRRRFPVSDLATIVRLVLSSRRGAMTLGVLALLVGQTAWSVFQGVPVESYYVRVSLVIACGIVMIILLPPAAIVLASSSPVSGKLLENSAKHAFPFRVISLLDGKYLGPTIFANKNDNLRTILGQSWRAAVHRLVEFTPLVIVDARSATPAVCEEIRHMLEPRRVGKAIFVVNQDGSAPGLREVGVETRHVPLVCCPADDLPEAIARFKRTGTVGPVTLGGGNVGGDIDGLMHALGHQDERVYEQAIEALAQKGRAALDSLVRVLGDNREHWLRRKNAALTLGRMECDFNNANLIDALRDIDRNVQQGAAWAVGKRRVREAVGPLANLLNDANCSWYTKAFAVNALGEIGTNEARAVLSSFAVQVEQTMQRLLQGEIDTTVELRLLHDFVAKRHVAFGGDLWDRRELARSMEFALRQFQEGLRVTLARVKL